MSYLLAVSIGPVQDFIAAARRTRDLWFGSFMLSEVSKAAAREIRERGGRLIFPAQDADLSDNDENESVANVILAELPNQDPNHIFRFARDKAHEKWRSYTQEAFEDFAEYIRSPIWKAQVDDVLEVYAAWVPYSPERYRADRNRLMRLLAGCKNYRAFHSNPVTVALPKSSLDGQRETVLEEFDRQKSTGKLLRLRLSSGEQLDIVGLTKRAAGGSRNYPSVMRVAADPWVRGNQKKEQFKKLVESCNDLAKKGSLHRVKHEVFENFPYEGIVLYSSRHRQWEEETKLTDEHLRQIRACLANLPEPIPYFAVLIADGDRMGATISRLPDADANRQFSSTLSQFAGNARQIVHKHHGVLVYAGGDDVLAFLPLDTCLLCARALHDAFSNALAKYSGEGHQKPTLSVGIAIGHCMDNLEDLLEYGRTAEKCAKQPDRNGLAIHLHKRSGAPIFFRRSWEDKPDQRLMEYAELIRKQALPNKLPYDLRSLANVYDGWPDENLSDAIQTDVIRVIRDKQPKAGRRYMREIEDTVHERIKSSSALTSWSIELLIARMIAEALSQSADAPGGTSKRTMI